MRGTVGRAQRDGISHRSSRAAAAALSKLPARRHLVVPAALPDSTDPPPGADAVPKRLHVLLRGRLESEELPGLAGQALQLEARRTGGSA